MSKLRSLHRCRSDLFLGSTSWAAIVWRGERRTTCKPLLEGGRLTSRELWVNDHFLNYQDSWMSSCQTFSSAKVSSTGDAEGQCGQVVGQHE
ncbi:hypothetical protein CDAR_51021 [Caerostris darwini]|uniref:Uncharacterized protein n=1 Tax=Caerostris darwini TaxID=1538125 RepID=A0AAV4U605_9ARAC|nr:hypothetical protein CDAR_51021 [Caerostris darwini]